MYCPNHAGDVLNFELVAGLAEMEESIRDRFTYQMTSHRQKKHSGKSAGESQASP